MALYLSNRDGGKTDEEGHYRFHVKAWTGNILSGFAVTQNSPLGMSVLVGTGDARVDYSNYGYTLWNDASAVATITTADPSNPRIDRVVVYIDRGATPQTTNPNNPGIPKIAVVAGTAAGSPVKANDAAVQSAVGSGNPWFEIATVAVAAGVTTISNGNITDTRSFIKIPLTGLPNGYEWVPFQGVSTYQSANLINTFSDFSSFVSIGDKIRLKQGGSYKYFYVVSVSSTQIGVNAGSDFTVANAAITDFAYSKAVSPHGFPTWFVYTPSFTGFSVAPVGIFKFMMVGRCVTVVQRCTTAGTSNANSYTTTAPIVSSTISGMFWGSSPWNANSQGTTTASTSRAYIGSNSTTITIGVAGNDNGWQTSLAKAVDFTLEYEIGS